MQDEIIWIGSMALMFRDGIWVEEFTLTDCEDDDD